MSTATKLAANIASAYKPRPGSIAPMKAFSAAPDLPDEEAKASGLELDDLAFMPASWFRLNPENEIFRALKSETYFRDLERDIAEAGEIVNPLIAMPDGLLIEGESRLIVAQRLGLDKLPVRRVLSALTLDEQRRRLWLGNLSRFEVDEDTRILLYSRIWPGYFRGDTVSPSPTRAEIAEATGKSERQVKRDAGIVREAAAKAEGEGRELGVEDVREAREKKAAERRERETRATTKRPEDAILRVRVVVDRLRKEAIEDGPEGRALRYAADLIEEALS